MQAAGSSLTTMVDEMPGTKQENLDVVLELVRQSMVSDRILVIHRRVVHQNAATFEKR